MMKLDDRLYTVAEVAALLRINRRTAEARYPFVHVGARNLRIAAHRLVEIHPDFFELRRDAQPAEKASG